MRFVLPEGNTAAGGFIEMCGAVSEMAGGGRQNRFYGESRAELPHTEYRSQQAAPLL